VAKEVMKLEEGRLGMRVAIHPNRGDRNAHVVCTIVRIQPGSHFGVTSLDGKINDLGVYPYHLYRVAKPTILLTED